MNAAVRYPLGYSEEEARRLEIQAALLKDFSAHMVDRAGLTTGMSVLDLGCGVGDLTFLVSQIIGPTGSVLGLDRSAASISTARKRAAALGLHNVRFEESDLTTFETTETFDAVVGRFVLLYLAEPDASLRRLRRSVRSGGLIAMQELDMSVAQQFPPSALFAKVNDWIFRAFDFGGADRDMGSKLLKTFLGAGLPRPDMMAMTHVSSGPNSPYYAFLTHMVRSMWATIEQAGLATAAEVDVDTLTARLRDDAVANERVLLPPRLMCAWSRLP